MRAVCKAQVTVLKGCLRTIRSEISFEHESNGWAKGAKAERRERGALRKNEGRRGEGAARRRDDAEKGRRGEGTENERRAKLATWGG